jgi:hypothetical protein
MAFEFGAFPSDWFNLRTNVRNNVFMDDDLVGGKVRVYCPRTNGRVADTWTGDADTTSIGSRRTLDGYESWETWTGGTWRVTSGKASPSGSDQQLAHIELSSAAGNGGNRDVSFEFTITTGSCYLGIHTKNGSHPSARALRATVGGKVTLGGFTGPTTVTAGTHTLRAVVTDTVAGVGGTAAVDIYLDGVLEGSTTMSEDSDSSSALCFGMAKGTGATGFGAISFRIDESAPTGATTAVVKQMVGGATLLSTPFTVSETIGVEYIEIDDSVLEMPTGGPYGNYHLMLTGTDRGDGDRGFQTSYGDIYFGRMANHANEITKPTKAAASAAVVSFDVLSHNWLGMGPVRWEKEFQSSASILSGATQEATWRNLASDHRPRNSVILLSSGSSNFGATTWTDAAKISLTSSVATVKSQVKAWESFNEPGVVIGGYALGDAGQAQDFVNIQHRPFYETVKAEDPDAIIMGPSIIGILGTSWIDNLYNAGFFDYTDALSFHAYNLCRKDIGRTRRILDEMFTKLATYGLQDIPIWQTEQGGLAEYDGVFIPEEAARDISHEVFMLELYGIIKERNIVWYDISHGFDSYPGFQFGHYDNGVLPVPLLMRNFEAELYDTQLTTRLDFGSAADLYAGGIFTRDDTSGVVGIMGQSSELGDVSVLIAGTTDPIELVDPWGNVTELTVTGSRVSVPVAANLVHWLRLPVGVTASLAASDWDWGTNLALSSGGASITGSGASFASASRAINGTHYSQGGYFDRPAYANSGTFSGTFPHYWTVNLGATTAIDTIAVRLIDATDVEIQASANGTDWTTLEHYQHTAEMIRYKGGGRCFWNRYESPAMALTWRGTRRDASHIRLKVNGSMATEQYLVAFDEVAQAVEAYDNTWPETYHQRMVHVPYIQAYNEGTVVRPFLLLTV